MWTKGTRSDSVARKYTHTISPHNTETNALMPPVLVLSSSQPVVIDKSLMSPTLLIFLLQEVLKPWSHFWCHNLLPNSRLTQTQPKSLKITTRLRLFLILKHLHWWKKSFRKVMKKSQWKTETEEMKTIRLCWTSICGNNESRFELKCERERYLGTHWRDVDVLTLDTEKFNQKSTKRGEN